MAKFKPNKNLFNAIVKYKTVLDYEKWVQYKTKAEYYKALEKAEIAIKKAVQ